MTTNPTTKPELHDALAAAGSCSEWVDLVAAYFGTAPLHYGHGTDNAADEAYWLVWHVCGMPEDLTDAATDRALLDRVAEIAARRVDERRPLAYLLGQAWFAGLPFVVTPDVLIPRSPLAELVENGFEPWSSLAPGDRVLEIGTGSGCIAIATAV
ncbi:MAG: hypothetical protein R3305_09110, partial [Gammaproteobacteria bacterium]|nr:hypothetical protein [Gammaproteobacteria bacterium]